MKNKKMLKYVMFGSLIIIFLIIIIFIILFFMYKDYKTNYYKVLSDNGFSLLNNYEFPWYLVEEDSENNLCMRPYDIGDSVITFGPGITYPTEQEGIDDINEKYNKNYTFENDCIDIYILNDLQLSIINVYEVDVAKFLYKNNLQLEQNQFDALVILDYNSPDFKKDEDVIEMLKSNPTQEDYIKAIDSYYQKLNAYFDNPNTIEENDGFGEGWYRRIVDSSEVYFFEEYDYQNNIEV